MITLKFKDETVTAEAEQTARNFLRRQKVKMAQVKIDGDLWIVDANYSEPSLKKVEALDPDAVRQEKGW